MPYFLDHLLVSVTELNVQANLNITAGLFAAAPFVAT
jgi:hypothetical protein